MRILLGQNTITRAERDSILALIDGAKKKLAAMSDVHLRIMNGTLSSAQAYGTEETAYDAASFEQEKIADRFSAIHSELLLDKQVYNFTQFDRDIVSRWVALTDEMYAIFQRNGVVAAEAPEAGGVPLWVYGTVALAAALSAIAIFAYEKPVRKGGRYADVAAFPRPTHDHPGAEERIPRFHPSGA